MLLTFFQRYLDNIHLLKVIRKLPKEVLKHYELWKRIIEFDGPVGLRKISGYHDENLKGKWKGYRSSRLNKQWRVIYKVEKKILQVFVVDINAHDYNRRK